MYSSISAVNEGFQIISIEADETVEFFLIPLQRQEGKIPEIWHMGLSMKKGENLSMGISWSGRFGKEEIMGPRDENLLENRIPWGS